MILKEAETKISGTAQIMYIRCLMYHFREKKPTVINASAFEMFKSDIRGYTKFEKYFKEMHRAGLVQIMSDRVCFQNMWGKHIDRSRLEKVSAEMFAMGHQTFKIDQFKDELMLSETLTQSVCMKNRISAAQAQRLKELFVIEKMGTEETYTDYSAVARNFTYWVPKNLENVNKEIVKSKGKMLGD